MVLLKRLVKLRSISRRKNGSGLSLLAKGFSLSWTNGSHFYRITNSTSLSRTTRNRIIIPFSTLSNEKVWIWLIGSIYSTHFSNPTLRPWLCFRSSWSYVCCLLCLSCLNKAISKKAFLKPGLKSPFQLLMRSGLCPRLILRWIGSISCFLTTTSHHSSGKPILEFPARLTRLMIGRENSPQPDLAIAVRHALYVCLWLVFFLFLKQF